MREKVIGILGGMGPEATLQLFKEILENTPASRDQEHLRIIIDNNPKIPERLPAILGNGESPVPLMVDSALILQNVGANFLIIPCVSAHYFINELQANLSIPILSILEKTAEEIAKYKPKIRRVGLLAAEGAIRASLFQDELKKRRIETLIPEGGDLKESQLSIFQIKNIKAGESRERIKEKFISIAKHLIGMGAEGILVGCTEISLVLEEGDLPVPMFDALSILARASIKVAGLEPITRQ
jgi:aspartate racemase